MVSETRRDATLDASRASSHHEESSSIVMMVVAARFRARARASFDAAEARPGETALGSRRSSSSFGMQLCRRIASAASRPASGKTRSDGAARRNDRKPTSQIEGNLSLPLSLTCQLVYTRLVDSQRSLNIYRCPVSPVRACVRAYVFSFAPANDSFSPRDIIYRRLMVSSSRARVLFRKTTSRETRAKTTSPRSVCFYV